MRNIGNPDYKPNNVYSVGLVSDDNNVDVVALEVTYKLIACCPHTADYGAGNPGGSDLHITDLDWLVISREFVRGGKHDDLLAEFEDHLLAFDPETGYWHPTSVIEKELALDYELRYTDIIIETSLAIGAYEEGDDE